VDDGARVLREGDFVHIPELEGSHANLRCDRCHNGGPTPPPTCTGCHVDVVDFRAGTLAAFELLELPAEPMVDLDCQDCHDLSQPASMETINPFCLDCHDDDDERFEPMLASWKREVDQLLADVDIAGDPERTAQLRALERAGPLHNMEATRIIVRALTDGRRVD
jgi:hypothetical protein